MPLDEGKQIQAPPNAAVVPFMLMPPPFHPIEFDPQSSPKDHRYLYGPYPWRLQHESWIPILYHHCDFGPDAFEQISINLIRNPNINSSHLFRADILYDSQDDQYTNVPWPVEELHKLRRDSVLEEGAVLGFRLKRTFIRQMIPRNPQLDRPVAQTCHVLNSINGSGPEQSLVVYVPHVTQLEELPWYHPGVQSLAYLHTWQERLTTPDLKPDSGESLASDRNNIRQGTLSVHYRLFSSQTLPLPSRVLRTAHHLLATVYKHGQGSLNGYTKKGHHDQLISQQRVQDTYTELKRKHAKRLCDDWVEQTEPSKHVFEDLGIAAFLLELWKNMYTIPDAARTFGNEESTSNLPPFPGFVDIGCGNGVLTEILLLSGYKGWGFDARRRKTWSILSEDTQEHLNELVLVPEPLIHISPDALNSKTNIRSRIRHAISPYRTLRDHEKFPTAWHNGIFPQSTFIISNHADELTSWTPLLASISLSPFLAIPCCSHNLSGMRFRAPSIFNSLSADNHAPAYFTKDIKRTKSISINVESDLEEEPDEDIDNLHHSLSIPRSAASNRQQPTSKPGAPETGDLKFLSLASRSKQPSAYSSLCDWVSHLASSVDYVVEREMLRIPSTRNVGIVGRTWVEGRMTKDEAARREKVLEIVRKEAADGKTWVERCEGLQQGEKRGKREGGH
ncbi:tRNA(Ser) Um(44) 2'-O-methyltransferase [Varicellaria rhodocarpa]|nr:tRNA(Ser) Um(44) 2'-O-methyltransferase [Varicellaria rhodocarpa]